MHGTGKQMVVDVRFADSRYIFHGGDGQLSGETCFDAVDPHRSQLVERADAFEATAADEADAVADGLNF
jgi:hypothetical protein